MTCRSCLLIPVILSAVPALAAEQPHPLHLLYFGEATPTPVTKPATYAFLPGQQLAPEAIYFDYRSDADALSSASLRNFDAVLLAVPKEKCTADQQKALDAFAAEGHGVKPVPANADPQAIRALALEAVGAGAKQAWEAFLAGRAPLEHEKRGDVANYERRPEPIPYQKPLTPAESMKYTQVPADFELKLFASEPNIFKPIAMAWDERGRLWIAETRDYPNEVRPEGEGNDDIKICEDTDGDGVADKFTIFADHLNIPTSLTFANGGVIVSQAPDFLFLKSSTGGDKADIRQVIFQGCWGKNDTHAGPSNLHYGFDNWLYGSVGYAGFKSTSGPANNFLQGIYRFRPDGSKIEFLYQFTNNTWGYGVNDAGDIFGSTANNAPSFFCGIPATDFAAGPRLNSAKRINTYNYVHPNTANIRQVDVFGGYTAAAGHMFMNSGTLPERFRGKALVCEPTCKLISVFDTVPDGAGYKANDGFNLLASSDEWMSPVAAEVGPDGAVWVADWYNFIIQHNPTPSPDRGGYRAETGKGGAHINPNRDTTRGRIYRLMPKGGQPGAIKSLAGAETADVVKALESNNQFWRLTAQRLLVEGRKADAASDLKTMVKRGSGTGAIHALWTLSGLGALDQETLHGALLASDPALRRNAVRALGTDDAAARLYFSTPLISDPDAATRLAALVKLSEFPATSEIKTVAAKLRTDRSILSDEWLSEAAKMLARKHGVIDYKAGPNLLPNPGFEQIADNLPQGWRVRHYAGNAKHEMASAPDAHGGKASLYMESTDTEGTDTSLFADVPVKAHTQYRLSAWIKTRNVRGALGALLNVHGSDIRTEAVSRTSNWREVEALFDTGDRTSLSVNCLFGGYGKSTGEAWFDDVALTELLPEEKKADIVADAKRGEDIFFHHQTALCVGCHSVGGKGGNVGPALDGIASRKDEAYILESLLEPNAKLAEGFTGQVSPMPPMGLILNDQELADVKAFLLSLKAK